MLTIATVLKASGVVALPGSHGYGLRSIPRCPYGACRLDGPVEDGDTAPTLWRCVRSASRGGRVVVVRGTS